MTSKLTEHSIEQNKNQGFEYFHGSKIASYTENTQKRRF